MRYFFLRHGETVEWTMGILLGSLPWTLSNTGKQEVKELATLFLKRGMRFKRIITSDLGRSIETSKILSRRLKIPIEIDSRIRERSAWVVEGRREKEIDWESYEVLPFPYRKHFGWESFFEVKKRARVFVDSLQDGSDENVLIVSHSVFIGMVISFVSWIPMKQAVKIKSDSEIPVYDSKKRAMEFVRLE